MSEKQNPKIPAQSGAPQEFYPPPPPGPPPNQQKPQHSNEVPLPDEKHPGYNPSRTDSELYESDYPPTQGQHHATTTSEPQKSTWGDKLSALGTKAAAPFNALANKMGSESFFPTTMDKECEKAARTLRSFCKDGIYTDADQAVPLTTGEVVKPKPKSRSLLTIPSKVISRAVGLAIFTTGRVGYGVSGSSGSGILIARLPDGRWSPPSGVQIHSIGTGFVMGLDIYDCVIVINTPEALKAFTSTRLSLGSDIAISAGPYGAGGSLEFAGGADSKGKDKAKVQGTSPAATPNVVPVDSKSEPNPFVPTAAPGTHPALDPATAGKDPKQPGALRKAISTPVFSYVKSRGLYAGWQIDGTVVTERKDANAAFYGVRVSVDEIMKGNVPAGGAWQGFAGQLHAVIKGAEGSHGSQQPGGGGVATPPGVGQQHFMSPAGGAPYYQPHPATMGEPAPNYQHPPSTMGDTAARDFKADAPTAQMEQLNVAGNRLSGQVPVQAAVPHTKAEEAAAEASGVHRSNTRATMLPAYSAQDPAPTPEAEPPAYVDDGVVRPAGGDRKTG